MYFKKKTEILKGRGVHDYGILREWGVTHFGISEGKGGLKHGSRPWLGMDIFWNCPFTKSIYIEIVAIAVISSDMELQSLKI